MIKSISSKIRRPVLAKVALSHAGHVSLDELLNLSALNIFSSVKWRE